jgi:hypothetical protein
MIHIDLFKVTDFTRAASMDDCTLLRVTMKRLHNSPCGRGSASAGRSAAA